MTPRAKLYFMWISLIMAATQSLNKVSIGTDSLFQGMVAILRQVTLV